LPPPIAAQQRQDEDRRERDRGARRERALVDRDRRQVQLLEHVVLGPKSQPAHAERDASRSGRSPSVPKPWRPPSKRDMRPLT
jgi:hypothetical protein